MESDSKTQEKNNSCKRNKLDVSHVLFALWVRWAIQIDNGYNGLLLGGRYGVLLYLRSILFVLYITVKLFEKI